MTEIELVVYETTTRFSQGGAIQVCFARELFPLLARPIIEMKRKLKWIFGALVAVFALLQFTNPARTNPPIAPGGDISATNPPPPQIAALLRPFSGRAHFHWSPFTPGPGARTQIPRRGVHKNLNRLLMES